MIAGLVAGLLAHQTDRAVSGLDADVQLIARYTIGTLTIIAVAAGWVPKADRGRVVLAMLRAAVGVGLGVAIGRAVDRLIK